MEVHTYMYMNNVQCFQCSDTIKICAGIIFDFYTGLPHTCMFQSYKTYYLKLPTYTCMYVYVYSAIRSQHVESVTVHAALAVPVSQSLSSPLPQENPPCQRPPLHGLDGAAPDHHSDAVVRRLHPLPPPARHGDPLRDVPAHRYRQADVSGHGVSTFIAVYNVHGPHTPYPMPQTARNP